MDALSQITDIENLIAHIRDGDLVALPSSFSGAFSAVSMAATRALIRRGIKDLHLLGVPALNFQADVLIGAGCVRAVEAGSILLYEYGPANRFVAAQKQGTIEVIDSTCPAIHAGLIAGEKGLPFMPVRGIIGSDLLRHQERRGAWKVIANPFADNDSIVTVRAIRPQVALFHAPLADRHGNVWVGPRDSLGTMARAAWKALVTFESWYDGNLLEDDRLISATIPAVFITAMSHQPRGAWPLGSGELSPEDSSHMREYARLSQTTEGFREYLEGFVLQQAT